MSDQGQGPYREAGAEAAPAWTVGEEHLALARDVVWRHALRTPAVPGPKLGIRAFLKLETQQKTGSFKVRGALTRLAALTDEERARGVVTASAGNHGLGVAYAGKALGVTATVYVPKGTADLKVHGMAQLGAHVKRTEAAGYDDTEALAREAADKDGAVFVSPYDDPWVAAGNGGTIGLELLQGLPNLGTVVAPVGGGGLLTGLAAARESAGRFVSLIGVQSEACPAMAQSLKDGHAIRRMHADETLAEGLEGGVSPTTFHHVKAAVERIDTVSEEAIADAMRFAYRQMGITVEGSAAVAVAWAREHLDAVPGDAVVALILTGRNVDPDTLGRILGSG